MTLNKTFDFLTEQDVPAIVQRSIYKDVKTLLLDLLYKELKKALEKADLMNKIQDDSVFNSSIGTFALAFQKNNLFYINGYIKGIFNINLSQLIESFGGVWDRKQKGYLIDFYSLPKTVQNIITQQDRGRDLLRTVLTFGVPAIILQLKQAIDEKDYSSEFANIITEAGNRISSQTALESINPANTKQFSIEYSNNTKLSIKNFIDQDVVKLRTDVLEILQKGSTHKEVKDLLNTHYNLNINRVQNIANQEVRLALTTFQEVKFTNAGEDEFYWVHTNPNSPTSRPVHVDWFKESNNGKVFSLKNKPINPLTGEAESPGSAYNCHCLARIKLKNS